MVVFEQLRVSDDGQSLYIDVHVNKSKYFTDIYIDKITICTEQQVSELHPLSYGEDFIYQITIDGQQKEVHLVLNCNDFNGKFTAHDLSHNMFFVYVTCKGTPDPCTPCRLDEMNTLGVTFDYGVMFNEAMNYTRELADTCNIPQNFLNFIMNYDALKLAIDTEHYIPAIKYWKNLMGDKGILNNTKGIVKPCGCHG